MVEAGEYDEAEGIDTDPVLRVLGAESESLGAPEIDSVVVDAGDHGTFEAEYELNEELGRYAADVELTDKLLNWSRGRDDDRVRALYPSEQLKRRIPIEVPEYTGAADAARMKAVFFRVAAELAAELESSRRACAKLAVTIGGRKLGRSFTPPITASDQLGRT